MKKTHLVAAMLAGMGIASTNVQALSITVTTMEFYDASGAEAFFGGGLNTSVIGSMNSTATGVITSGTTPFLGTPWTATQVMWEDTHGAPLTWSGTSASGPYSYNYTLTGNQVAVGMLFTWGAAVDIAVLQIFDCGPGPSACVGINSDTVHSNVPGSEMDNGPFAGQHAVFKGTTLDIIDADPIANNDAVGALIDATNTIVVLTNDTDNEDGSPPPAPPAVVTTVGGTSAQGFTIAANADGTVTYVTTGGYAGADSFQYTLTDSFGNVSAAATVNITVAPPNQAPVATNPSLAYK